MQGILITSTDITKLSGYESIPFVTVMEKFATTQKTTCAGMNLQR